METSVRNYVIKSDICYSKSSKDICFVENGYLICEENKCAGVYEKLPEKYEYLPLLDYSGKLVIPGLVDLHVHAPQYPFRGMAMDLELIDWLNTYTFVEEAKYKDIAYAEKVSPSSPITFIGKSRRN